MEAGNDFRIRDLAGTALEYLLAAAGNGHQTALARAFGFEIKVLKQGGQLPGEKILKGDAGTVPAICGSRKAGVLVGDLYVEAGRRGKGIPLHMVNKKGIAAEMVGACQRFIGWVAFMVNGAQQGAQFVR